MMIRLRPRIRIHVVNNFPVVGTSRLSVLIIFLQLFGLRLVTVDRVPLDLCLDHVEDAVGILTLLLVSQACLRRRRRRDSLDMTDSDAGDASWSISESKGM